MQRYSGYQCLTRAVLPFYSRMVITVLIVYQPGQKTGDTFWKQSHLFCISTAHIPKHFTLKHMPVEFLIKSFCSQRGFNRELVIKNLCSPFLPDRLFYSRLYSKTFFIRIRFILAQGN